MCGSARTAFATLLLLACISSSSAAPDSVAAILSRISPPEIASVDFPVPESSAPNANSAINAAINQVSAHAVYCQHCSICIF